MKSKRHYANAYRRAAKFFDENPDKWIRCRLTDNMGSYCAVGRLGVELYGDAEGGGWRRSTHRDFVVRQKLIALERAVLGDSLSMINDFASGGLRDVKRAIRKIARALDHGAKL